MLQSAVNALAQGCLLAVLAMAFNLVFSTSRVFHVAMGGIYTMSPYVMRALALRGVPSWAAAIGAIGCAALLGAVIERAIYWPLARRSAPTEVQLVASLGLYIVVVQGTILVWGNESLQLRVASDHVFHLGSLTLTAAQLASVLLGATAIAGARLLLMREGVGLLTRAMAGDPVLLSIHGGNAPRVRAFTSIVSGALTATVALVAAWDVGFDAHGGIQATLLGMIGAVFAGRSAFLGAAFGGLLLGVIRVSIAYVGATRWQDAATFSAFALLLAMRPQGIWGGRERVEEVAS